VRPCVRSRMPSAAWWAYGKELSIIRGVPNGTPLFGSQNLLVDWPSDGALWRKNCLGERLGFSRAHFCATRTTPLGTGFCTTPSRPVFLYRGTTHKKLVEPRSGAGEHGSVLRLGRSGESLVGFCEMLHELIGRSPMLPISYSLSSQANSD
jgi:hypothetical protein